MGVSAHRLRMFDRDRGRETDRAGGIIRDSGSEAGCGWTFRYFQGWLEVRQGQITSGGGLRQYRRALLYIAGGLCALYKTSKRGSFEFCWD